jgi:predicted nucleic acid-binding protein
MKVLVDSNILIDFFQGNTRALDQLEKYEDIALSRITWIEALIGAPNTKAENTRKSFLSKLKILEITPLVAEKSIDLRREYRLKLPDCLIWATAQLDDRVLITLDKKDFPKNHPSIYFPY